MREGKPMTKRAVWLVVSGLMVISLAMASCSQAAVTTSQAAQTTPATQTAPTTSKAPAVPPSETVKPAAEAPKYGGTLTLVATADPANWDPVRNITGTQFNLTHQKLWAGDWAKGPAGGFGTSETDWGFANNDIFGLRKGCVAESWKWTIDEATGKSAIVFQIRRGIRWQLPNTEAGRLVNGRELTADDVLSSLKRATTLSVSFTWRLAPTLRDADIRKTGPWEVTASSLSADQLLSGLACYGGYAFIQSPEVIAKYGDLQNWQNYVGTGPFMLTDFISNSSITLARNPNYWEKDPVGPGKGNQLPYLDGVKVLVIPDESTRYAAFRSGKIDWINNVLREDANTIKKTVPGLMEKWSTSYQGRGTPLQMRTDKAPFNDIRVRKAMMLATDFQTILQNLYGGVGQIVTVPFSKVTGYEKLYLGLEDPDFPPEAKDLYKYNPEKAKLLLKEAGYPNGFNTKVLISSTVTTQIDYTAVIKDMWAKVGIGLELDLRENAVVSNISNARTHEAMAYSTTGPVGDFYSCVQYLGQGVGNLSMVNDPVVNAAMKKVRLAMLTNDYEAMRIFREEVSKYAVQQAWCIPNVQGSFHNLWRPWLKNYSGEITIGFDQFVWPQYIWYDQNMKKTMGQ
jgi:peptide/nickel transport system substrate-binding protein